MEKKSLFGEENNGMWLLVKQGSKANKSGFWIEAVSCRYYFFIFSLRKLLSWRGQLSKNDINKLRYLSDLAKKACAFGLLSDGEHDDLIGFNKRRGQLIHNLLNLKDGAYNDFEKEYLDSSKLVVMLQEKLIGPCKFGSVESREDFLKQKNKLLNNIKAL